MLPKYIYHSTCYDKELFRTQALLLKENGLDFKIEAKETRIQSRAPLGGYFEVELFVEEKDFEKADLLLSNLNKT